MHNFHFASNFDAFFCYELIVTRASGSIPADMVLGLNLVVDVHLLWWHFAGLGVALYCHCYTLTVEF